MRPLRNRLSQIGILRPLARRDFAMLTAGSFVSQLGDGFFFVALAWQVYEISNVPTAMSLVGLAWTLPLVLFVLPGVREPERGPMPEGPGGTDGAGFPPLEPVA